MIWRAALLVLILFVGMVTTAAAQDPAVPPVTEIILTDGSTLIGTVVSETSSSIEFRTTAGVLVSIETTQIRSRRTLAGRMRDGIFRPSDPNVSRLLFTATGRPVGKGKGYFADYYVFLPFVAYGVSDVVTMAGGISLLPGSPEQLIYLAPKVTVVNGPQGSVSAGVLAGTLTGEDDWGGILYGAGTIGDGNNEYTGGVGFLFGGGEVWTTPILMGGMSIGLGRTTKFISENYMVFEDGPHVLVSGGIRFFGERLAADLALFTAPELFDDLEGFPFFPFVGFAYNFGR